MKIINPKINLKSLTNKIYYKYFWDYKRHNIFYGGASSGKSDFVASRILYRCITERGRNFLVVRKVDRTNRNSTFALIQQIMSRWNVNHLFRINKSDMTITNTNGNQILFQGLDDVEKVKSLTFPRGILTDIWGEEATEFSLKDHIILNMRLRGASRHKKQLTYTFNPISQFSWAKEQFFDKPLPDSQCSILKTTYKNNAYLEEEDKVAIENLKREDKTYYDIYALGNWGVLGNLIFTNYVIENFDLKAEDFDETCWGIDFGIVHPFAIEKAGFKDGELYIYDELYTKGYTNNEVIRMNEEEKVLLRDDVCTADSARPDNITEWQQQGYNVSGAKKGPGSVRFGIDFLKRHRIHIHKSNCPGIAAEIGLYKWKENKNGDIIYPEEPVKFRDDGIDALRYATEYIWRNQDLKVTMSQGIW